VKAVDDLNRARKQFLSDIPDPWGSVGNHDHSLRFTGAAPCLPQHAFGEGGALLGIGSSAAISSPSTSALRSTWLPPISLNNWLPS
jgi:hypothetical protein